jgi:hypothetical protein
LSIVSDVVEQLVQSQSLDFFGFHVTAGIVEVKDDIALVNLLHEQLLSSIRRDFVEPRELFELSMG